MSATSPQPVLRLDRVTKSFGRITAVDSLSFDVHEGDVFGFLGPNGAGKSTTFYMVAGLVRPTSGAIEIFGKPPSDLPVARSGMGALLETPAFYEYLSAQRNLEVLARLQRGIAASRIGEVLEMVGLTARARDPVGDYSHGMKQRLGIAQALLNRPRLLLLDEPTSGLDPEGSQQMWATLRRLAAEKVTIVISSHLLHEVEEGCNRIAVINQGMLVACDEVRRLLFFSREDYLVVFDTEEQRTGAEKALREAGGVEIIAHDAEPAMSPLLPADGAGLWVRVRANTASQVLGRLVEAGFAPREFVRQRKTLKQFFLDLTRRQPVPAAAAQGVSEHVL